MTDRLSAEDASFLYLEGAKTPYHVASLLLFEHRPDDDYRRLTQLLAGRLHLVPRFRQKVAFVPLGAGLPVWVDDTDFDLGYHIRPLTLPAPGTEEQLAQACSCLMEQHLSRTRPLWELYLIDGLEGDRFAVFTKTHHAMVDGVSGVDLAVLLLDPTPDPADVREMPFTPSPPPPPVRLLAEAITDRLRQPADAIRTLAHPGRLARAAKDIVVGVRDLAWAAVHPAPNSPLNVRVGPNRRVAWVRASLDDFKATKDRLGGTINDAVLTVVAGALRKWLVHRDYPVGGVNLKTMVPVSIRQTDERGQLGNRVSTILAPLFIWEPDHARRFALIHDGALKAKRSRQSEGAHFLIELSGLAPPVILTRIMNVQNVQRLSNVLVTNIPGPQEPLYAAGHRLLDIFPFTPLAGNMALIVAVISYAGRMEFGLIADAQAIPDLDVLARGLEQSIEELMKEDHRALRPHHHARHAV